MKYQLEQCYKCEFHSVTRIHYTVVIIDRIVYLNTNEAPLTVIKLAWYMASQDKQQTRISLFLCFDLFQKTINSMSDIFQAYWYVVIHLRRACYRISNVGYKVVIEYPLRIYKDIY